LPFAAFFVSRLGEAFHEELAMRSVWLVSTSTYLAYFLACHNVTLVISEATVLGMSIWKVRALLQARRAPRQAKEVAQRSLPQLPAPASAEVTQAPA
jgi:hypothetical protein